MQEVSITHFRRTMGRQEGLHASYWRPHEDCRLSEAVGTSSSSFDVDFLRVSASFRCRPGVRTSATSIWPFCGRRGVLHEDVKRCRMRLTRLSAITMSMQSSMGSGSSRCRTVWPVWKPKFVGPFGPGLEHACMYRVSHRSSPVRRDCIPIASTPHTYVH